MCRRGRGSGTRTHGLIVPNDARYQLRHTPPTAAQNSLAFTGQGLHADFILPIGGKLRYTPTPEGKTMKIELVLDARTIPRLNGGKLRRVSIKKRI